MFRKTMRYYKKHFMHWGKNTFIFNPYCISHPEMVIIGDNTKILDNIRLLIYPKEKTIKGEDSVLLSIGDHCYINPNFSLLTQYRVSIGNNVIIAANVLITGHNHGIDPESDIPYMDQELTGEEVTVGDGTWIGEKSCILAGVHIGKKCVIGAGSVVTKDVPDYCLAVGNPARVIKKYDFDSHMWKKI